MRTHAFLSAALLALAVPTLAQAPKWTTFAAPGDGFSILMPGKAQLTKQNTQGVVTNIYLAFGPPFVCAASKTILPAGGFKASDLAQMEKAMKSSMLASSHSTSTGEHPATYAGIAGRQMEFRTANGGSGAMWIGRTSRAVYSLTLAKQTPASPAEAKRFFGSFRQG